MRVKSRIQIKSTKARSSLTIPASLKTLQNHGRQHDENKVKIQDKVAQTIINDETCRIKALSLIGLPVFSCYSTVDDRCFENEINIFCTQSGLFALNYQVDPIFFQNRILLTVSISR